MRPPPRPSPIEDGSVLLIPCPYCGPRPEIEFRNAGEAHIARPADPIAVSDEAWAEFLYRRTNPKGVHAERWRHTHGCARFFNALRDTVSDKILATYKAGEPRPSLEAGRDPGPLLPQGSEDVGREAAGGEERP